MINNKIVVGIFPTIDRSDETPYKDRDRFITMYEDMIIKCGGIPIGLLDKNITMYTDICDAYLWPGGSIIEKEFYNIFDDILKNHKPLLGVCLGSQAIATFFNILEDQKDEPNLSLLEIYDNNKIDHTYLNKLEGDRLSFHSNTVTKDPEVIKKACHEIKIKKNTFLYDIYKTNKINVASMHSYTIARTSKDIIVSATTNDGVIEAIEYHQNNNHILGVQYHPELLNDYKIFNWLIENAYNKYLVLINKEHEIMNNNFKILYYKDKNIYNTNENGLEENTYNAFMMLKDHLNKLGFNMELASGFRTTDIQIKTFEETEKEKGLEYAKMYVAPPLHSEHETGLAADVCLNINGKLYYEFEKELDEFYKTFHKEVSKFGFILRYPKGKEKITGYNYEPWHIRYIGNIKLAKKIMDEKITLEEYYNQIDNKYNIK